MILDIIILPTLFAATQLFKLMDKYRPETKQAKKERLRERAAARFVERLKRGWTCFKIILNITCH